MVGPVEQAAADKYNCYTIHYINWNEAEPRLKTKVLECAPFNQKSTSEELEKELRRVAEVHNISSKLVLNVADGAADIQKALHLFGKPRIACTNHKLNNAAQYVIKHCKKISDLKSKLAHIVRTTKISSKSKNILHECQRKVGLNGKKIIAHFDKFCLQFNFFWLCHCPYLSLFTFLISKSSYILTNFNFEN